VGGGSHFKKSSGGRKIEEKQTPRSKKRWGTEKVSEKKKGGLLVQEKNTV